MLGDIIEVQHPDSDQALRIPLAAGDEGVADTIETMRSIVLDADSRGTTRATASRITADRLGRAATLDALFAWMRRHIDFCRDPKRIERIRHPELLLWEIMKTGRTCVDCDESATLAAALLLGAEFTPVFITVSQSRGGDFSHVYAGVAAGEGRVIAFDPQETAHVGMEARHERRKLWPIIR